MSAKKSRRRYDWYTISSETLRGWGWLVFLLIAAVVGWRGWEFAKREMLARDLTVAVEEAQRLLDTLENDPGIEAFGKRLEAARGHFAEARSRASAGEVQQALRSAERSRTLLQSIYSELRNRGHAAEARFIAVRGGVEFRRGDRGSWEPARGRVALQPGDYVKTSGNGSAEIMAADGTVYTVRSDTVILVGESRAGGRRVAERTINVEFGWVDLSTAGSGSRVTTPQAEARVRRDSDAVISYDQQQRVSRFAAYRGEVEVASASGEKRELGALEQVVQRGPTLSPPMPLPSAPMPIEPVEDFEADLKTTSRLVLRWEPVSGAERYALQVARDRLFVKNVIDVVDRDGPAATIGLRGEGIFTWRVAALDAEGVQGPWSSVRRFRVTSTVAASNVGGT